MSSAYKHTRGEHPAIPPTFKNVGFLATIFMSRLYEIAVDIRTTSPDMDEVEDVVLTTLGGEGDMEDAMWLTLPPGWHQYEMTVQTKLCGGQSEQEAHTELSKALKAAFPDARIQTRFTYLEDLPYEEYDDGDWELDEVTTP